MEPLDPPAPLVCQSVGASRSIRALADTGASPCVLSSRSPLLTFRLLEPAGEVVDAHVLELEQVLQAPHLHLEDLGRTAQRSSPGTRCPLSPLQAPSPRAVSHLHSLLRGQQLLLLFSDLEDEAGVAMPPLATPRRPGSPGVGSSLAEAWRLGLTLTLPAPFDQAFPPPPAPIPAFPTFPGASQLCAR